MPALSIPDGLRFGASLARSSRTRERKWGVKNSATRSAAMLPPVIIDLGAEDIFLLPYRMGIFHARTKTDLLSNAIPDFHLLNAPSDTYRSRCPLTETWRTPFRDNRQPVTLHHSTTALPNRNTQTLQCRAVETCDLHISTRLIAQRLSARCRQHEQRSSSTLHDLDGVRLLPARGHASFHVQTPPDRCRLQKRRGRSGGVHAAAPSSPPTKESVPRPYD